MSRKMTFTEDQLKAYEKYLDGLEAKHESERAKQDRHLNRIASKRKGLEAALRRDVSEKVQAVLKAIGADATPSPGPKKVSSPAAAKVETIEMPLEEKKEVDLPKKKHFLDF